MFPDESPRDSPLVILQYLIVYNRTNFKSRRKLYTSAFYHSSNFERLRQYKGFGSQIKIIVY